MSTNDNNGNDKDASGSTKRPRESSNSPNSDKNKRQKGTKYICPICMEVIKENTSKRNGDQMMQFFVKTYVMLGYIDNVQGYQKWLLMH